MGNTALIRQAYRYALDPTAEQETLLVSFTGASRFWFNQGLALVKERLDARESGEQVQVPWSYKALCSALKGDAIKDELAPWALGGPCRFLPGGPGDARAGVAELLEGPEGRSAGGLPKVSREGPLHGVRHLSEAAHQVRTPS
jgi:putative transposase